MLLDRGRFDLLEREPSLGLLCALTRLQECGAGTIEQATLERLAGCRADATTYGTAMLRPYEWEHRTWLRLASTADRVGADGWIAAHPADVEAAVTRPDAPAGLIAGLVGWWLAHDARDGRTEGNVLDAAEHAGLLLDADRSPATIDLLMRAPFTSWTLTEAAHTVVRVWPSLPAGPRAQLLDRLVSDTDALGPYGLLESCLYLTGAASAEIWDQVKASMWKMLRSPDPWQAALCLDGLAWRLPPDVGPSSDWARAALRVVPAGPLAVIAAYHPEGVAALGIATDVEQRALHSVIADDAMEAEQLIIWHFVHQSRARAQMSRQHWVDKGYLCRTLHPGDPSGTDTRAIDRLIGALVAAGRPGWAFHAACFIMGALERPVGAAAKRLLADAIPGAPNRDLGIVTAACTYRVATEGEFARPVREYFSRRDNRDSLIDAYAGLTLPDGTTVRPPEALFTLPAGEVYQRLGVRFHRLVALGYDATEPHLVVAAIRPAIDAAVVDGTLPESVAGALLQLIDEGDFRPLDDAAAAFDGGSAPALGSLAIRAAADLAVVT